MSQHILCVGGGHCNVQVLKMLKKTMPKDAKLTLVTEVHQSYYSGMLPGSTACKHLFLTHDSQSYTLTSRFKSTLKS